MYPAADTETRSGKIFGEDMAEEIRQGLTAPQKYIPSKYFYDARGSRLFERICDLPEYYIPRAEASILRKISPDLVPTLKGEDLVELGSGSEWKIRILLDTAGPGIRSCIRYIPIDICEEAVIASSHKLRDKYPELQIQGLVADFTSHMDLVPMERPRFICFLGSTIGNFNRSESASFLSSVSASMTADDRLMIGFDMLKAPQVLNPAYNDADGITAQFNRNILNVLNRRLDGDFDLSHFDHLAFFNAAESRVEMHLKANRDCSVQLNTAGLKIFLHEGETIHTENSHKFTVEDIEGLAGIAGLVIHEWYMDPQEWFSLVIMGTAG